MEGQNYSVKERLEQLETFMGKYTAGGRDLCVAFSGGVDSSLLLKLVMDASAKHGTKVYAVTFQTRLHPPCDLETATRVAKEVGAVHEVLYVDELEQEAIRCNPENRCYLCKHELFEKILAIAGEYHIRAVVEGSNMDDNGDYAAAAAMSILIFLINVAVRTIYEFVNAALVKRLNRWKGGTK